MKRNQDIKNAIKNAGLSNWKVAESLGVHENTFYRMLRYELSQEYQEKIMKIIEGVRSTQNE
ncbi:hypothetical protein [Priestia megaterium]|uniref:hypothetical protein n=1 Tax=Priestia megaterium TaxID=1404 RepID=UPI000BF2F3D8|nr:hypothetical protein [Priestia megaterium]PFR94850.1 hypothetical protein COK39_15055 [Priestia megaterium]